jgi:hypothetical protein
VSGLFSFYPAGILSSCSSGSLVWHYPMHVESVAWISERKDLLYTLFYVGAMIAYLYYLEKKQLKNLVTVSILGAISLLCKPAAIVLPLSLLLLDYYFKRKWSPALIIEKIPLFIFSAVMAIATFSIQADRAVASIEYHTYLERFCFAGFGLIWYLVKFVFPYPLSGLHPFPDNLSLMYYGANVSFHCRMRVNDLESPQQEYSFLHLAFISRQPCSCFTNHFSWKCSCG